MPDRLRRVPIMAMANAAYQPKPATAPDLHSVIVGLYGNTISYKYCVGRIGASPMTTWDREVRMKWVTDFGDQVIRAIACGSTSLSRLSRRLTACVIEHKLW